MTSLSPGRHGLICLIDNTARRREGTPLGCGVAALLLARRLFESSRPLSLAAEYGFVAAALDPFLNAELLSNGC
jgi:hypothetical protein